MQNIVLLHGALGSSEDLKPLSKALAIAGIKAHSFSFSGHGLSPFNPEFGIEQFSGELDAFLKQEELSQPAVFGYSMGGYVALNYALAHGNTLGPIITLGTKFNWSAETVKKETGLLDPAVMTEKVPAFAKMLQAKHGSQWEKLVIRTAGMMRDISAKDFLNSATLKTIGNKTLIGLADKDNMVSLDETVTVFRTLPNAQMYMLPGTKHPVETCNPDLLSNIIAGFTLP